MTINIEALKASVAKIERLGQDELTFTAGQETITLRALKSHEELEVERYGQVAWDEATSDEDRAALADYLDRMRNATLSHVIIQIGDLDLRNEEFIETGEVDQNGTPIKKPRYLVMRELIKQWNRHILHLCYLKYAELMQRIELHAGKAIEFDVTDTDKEINRLENRIDQLRKLKEDAEAHRQEETRSTQVREAIKNLGEQSQDRKESFRNAQEAVDSAAFQARAAREQEHPPQPQGQPQGQPQSEPAPQPQPQQPQPQGQPQSEGRRRSPMPTRGAPPQREAPPPEPPEQEVEVDESGIPTPYEGDSMFDPADGDEAMHAEHARQMAHRRQMAQQRQGEEPPIIPPEAAPPTGNKPPHRDALNAQDAKVRFGDEVQARPKGANQDLQGVRLPTETLSDRTRGQGQPPGRGARAPVDKVPGSGSRNPRFKGPQGG